MSPPPIPANEAARQAALDRAEVLDTPPEAAFDNLAKLAASICEVPIALVTFVDRDRQWFKARVGLMREQTPREHSFCGHAVAADDTLVVPDAHADDRFATNPLVVGDPRIRFYAGVPLRAADGAALGTLCVIDRVPRQLSPAQMQALDMLARQASTELRLRNELRRVRQVRRAASPAAATEATLPEGASLWASAALPLSPGQVVAGRYRVERAIGQGAMGIVFTARDLLAGEGGAPVALKLLRPELVQSHAAVERFAREARLVMGLRDPHIARVLDVGNTEDDLPFVIFELLEGEDLATRLDRAGKLEVPAAIDLALQACRGVAAAHEAGVVHRDIKPANLFLARLPGHNAPTVKVVDFGIAKALAVEPAEGERQAVALTAARMVVGSPQYMAPEQMFGAPDIDARADVWSLGVVLYEMLAGVPPFVGETLKEVCNAVILRPAPPLAAAREGLSPPVVEVIERCLSKEREQRYPDAAALGRALRQAAGG
ncbi:MAG TPA: protein kinase [Polyangia bacterium]|nr:protein kinase [Polyangia bacterium]